MNEEKSLYIGEPDIWRSGDSEERANQMITWCLLASAQHYGPLRTNWDDYFDRYTGQPSRIRQTNRIRSQVPSGRASEIIDTYRADFMEQIYKNDPLISAQTRDATKQDIAQIREDLIQFQLDNATPDMGSWPVIDTVVLNGLLYGGCPVKQSWERRIIVDTFGGVELPSVAYEGPVPISWFPYDYFPHPQKQWADDHYPVVCASFESYDDILKLRDAGVYMNSVDEIPDMAGMKARMGDNGKGIIDAFGDMYERADQRARMGWTGEDSRLRQDGVLVLECECMFRPKVEWVDKAGRKHKGDMPVRSILTMANGVIIRISPSPMRNGNSVWTMAKLNHLPGHFYGLSLIQKIKPMLHVEEVALNMGLQNLAVSVNRMKVVRPDLLHSSSTLDDQPGGVLYAKPGADINAVAREIQTTSVLNEVMAMIRYAADREEGISAATDLKQGRIPTGERTATASNLAFGQASVRFKHGLSWLGASFFLPMARKMDIFNQDYLETPFAIQILGQDRAMRMHEVTDQALRVPVSYRFEGPTRAENENLRISQLQNALKTITPMVQLVPGMDAAAKEIVVQLLDRFNVPDLDKIKKLIGYGMSTPPMEPGGGGSEQGVRPGGPPGGSMRRESRVGSPMASLAKQLGGALSASQMGRG